MDQDRIIYIVVDRVGAPYQVLLYQPGIRFSLWTNSKVLSLQHHSLNTRSLILNIILSPFHHYSVSLFFLSAFYFISSCTFLNVALASFYKFCCLLHFFFLSNICFHPQFSTIVCHKQRYFGCWICFIDCKFSHC